MSRTWPAAWPAGASSGFDYRRLRRRARAIASVATVHHGRVEGRPGTEHPHAPESRGGAIASSTLPMPASWFVPPAPPLEFRPPVPVDERPPLDAPPVADFPPVD